MRTVDPSPGLSKSSNRPGSVAGPATRAWMLATTALGPAIWGTTYVVTTELLPAGRPLLAATLRTLPVGALLLIRSRRLPRSSWWWRAGVLGALNIGVFQALLFVAAFRLPGGVAATVGAIQPLVAAALAAILLGEAFTRRTAIAGSCGVAGVGLLVLRPDAALDPVGLGAALVATLAMATGVVLTKHWGRPVDLLTFTGWQLIAGGLMLAPVTVLVEGMPPAMTVGNLAGFAWLGIVGTGVAYALWFRGIGTLEVSMTSFLALLSPVVATLIGWLVLGQSLTALQLVGVVIVAAAVIAPQVGDGRQGQPKRYVLIPFETTRTACSRWPVSRARGCLCCQTWPGRQRWLPPREPEGPGSE